MRADDTRSSLDVTLLAPTHPQVITAQILTRRNAAAVSVSCLALFFAGCWGSRGVVASGEALTAANEARAQGKKSTSISLYVDFDQRTSLQELLKTNAAIMVAPHQPAAVTTARDVIQTWSVLRITELVRRQPPVGTENCSEPPPISLPASESLVAVPTLEGTVEINGVHVTMNAPNNQVSFGKGRSYLLIGLSCPNKTFFLARGILSMAGVAPDGQFEPLTPLWQQNQVLADLMKLGTIANFRAFVDEVSK